LSFCFRRLRAISCIRQQLARLAKKTVRPFSSILVTKIGLFSAYKGQTKTVKGALTVTVSG